jgi:nucleotide-binding universal stress UspA family protein
MITKHPDDEERVMSSSHIVLALDGSVGSVAAARWCARFAAGMEAQVTAVYVLDSLAIAPPGSVIAPLFYDDEAKHRLAETLEEWCAPLREAKVAYTSELIEGTPADVITKEADRLKADVVVVGRRGRGGFAELVLGSVPHHLTHHCPHPVLVVPAS